MTQPEQTPEPTVTRGERQPPAFHPAIAQLLQHFAFAHLPAHLAEISRPFAELAWFLASPDGLGLEGPELAAGLRHLLEAKDCAVRAALPPRELVDPRTLRPRPAPGEIADPEAYDRAVADGTIKPLDEDSESHEQL